MSESEPPEGDGGRSPDAARGGPAQPPDPAAWVDRVIAPFLEESMLWPVAFVLVAHAAVFIAPVLLYAVRDRAPASIVAIAGLGFLTVSGIRLDFRRPTRRGILAGVLLAIWALAGAAAWLVDRVGYF